MEPSSRALAGAIIGAISVHAVLLWMLAAFVDSTKEGSPRRDPQSLTITWSAGHAGPTARPPQPTPSQMANAVNEAPSPPSRAESPAQPPRAITAKEHRPDPSSPVPDPVQVENDARALRSSSQPEGSRLPRRRGASREGDVRRADAAPDPSPPATPRQRRQAAAAPPAARAAFHRPQVVPIRQQSPVYPARARRRGIEGYVEIEFLVDPLGRVQDLEIIAAHPPGIFEQAVKRAVRTWRFRVSGARGQSVRVRETVRFRLDS